ncbi:hypothetical protein FOA52_012332 [Chlamydomonas sp. UWO 241]|nr:hypothetical protein FOA52_012332 [Chlamydomonas sp. UWO 241]
MPGCYDALSAEIMARAGHKTGFVSGYAVAATLLGEPDLGLLTMPEMSRKVSQICTAAPGLHVIADADTGGGNVLNVQRTVKQLIQAGAKGCMIEDQVWPRGPGQLRSKDVIAMEEFAGKVAAARLVIQDQDFFLIARTDARSSSGKYGLEDAITRANLYCDAGANASYIQGPRTLDELRKIGRKTKGIRVCNMMETSPAYPPLCTPEELKDMGFHIVLHPLSGLYAATKALINVYELLATKGTTRDNLSDLVTYTEFNEIINLEEKISIDNVVRQRDQKLTVRVRAPSVSVDNTNS